jgi:hypothetical protein
MFWEGIPVLVNPRREAFTERDNKETTARARFSVFRRDSLQRNRKI